LSVNLLCDNLSVNGFPLLVEFSRVFLFFFFKLICTKGTMFFHVYAVRDEKMFTIKVKHWCVLVMSKNPTFKDACDSVLPANIPPGCYLVAEDAPECN
jgi:hypothetical protein